jgi:hypothetical protein
MKQHYGSVGYSHLLGPAPLPPSATTQENADTATQTRKTKSKSTNN